MPDKTLSPFQEPMEDVRCEPSEATPEGPGETANEAPAADRPSDPAPTAQMGLPDEPARGLEAPSIDSLGADSNLGAFMSPEVGEPLRRQALRKWFHLPVFNHRDGLDDYDGDYRRFEALGDVVTAHLRHQMHRLANESADPCAQGAGQKTARDSSRPPDISLKRPPVTEMRFNQMPPSENKWIPVRCPGASREGLPDCDAGLEPALLWHSAGCVHRSAGLPGCTRCRDACAHAAIDFDAQGLKIRPERCRGDGACAAACPTGALRPADDDTLAMLTSIRTAASTGGTGICAAFCSALTSEETLQSLQNRLPESVLVLRSRPPAVPGPEAWLAALAMGAARVCVLDDAPTPVRQDQFRFARAVIAGLDLDATARLTDTGVLAPDEQIERVPPLGPLAPADWEPSGEKRALLWQAIEHLHDQFPDAPDQAPLPSGAPFGEVRLAPSRCTLCMACVGACPTGALLPGSHQPQVRFRERDCIQCGMCRQICPEQAVTLTPRICYGRDQTRNPRVLHQEEPLRCSVCGVPFATPAMVAAVTRKLSAHWMYQDPSAKDRLTMCRDCRIRSLYAARRPLPGRSGSGRAG